MNEQDNRYFRWAMIIARAEGVLSGVQRAFADHGTRSMPELADSEAELGALRNELRDLAVKQSA